MYCLSPSLGTIDHFGLHEVFTVNSLNFPFCHCGLGSSSFPFSPLSNFLRVLAPPERLPDPRAHFLPWLFFHLKLPEYRFTMEFEVSDCSDMSSLASSPRCSPEPATRYLTPSSQEEDAICQDYPPAKKRRRNPLPKERTTQYLKLSQSSETQKDQARLLVETLRHQKDIVVIAGAGISTSAGSKFSPNPIPPMRNDTTYTCI